MASATLIAAVGGTAWLAAQAPAGRTVWEGVYSETQAERGTAIFGQSCSNCHTFSPQGNHPLGGDAFWKSYSQKTVGDLIAYVSANMPNGNGGSLPASSYNDLVAFILKSNGFPAGSGELAPESAAEVQIIPKDGPGELPADTLARVVGCLSKNGADWVLTNATVPQRIDRTGPAPEDATRPLGTRRTTLKFVLTRLDSYVGHRMSVSGMLMGTGGADGINVTTVAPVGETCP
jgi:cytochrome c5